MELAVSGELDMRWKLSCAVVGDFCKKVEILAVGMMGAREHKMVLAYLVREVPRMRIECCPYAVRNVDADVTGREKEDHFCTSHLQSHRYSRYSRRSAQVTMI